MALRGIKPRRSPPEKSDVMATQAFEEMSNDTGHRFAARFYREGPA